MLTTLLVHPVGQAISLLFGLFNLITGLTRKGLNLTLHINAGFIFCFTVLIGAGVGKLITLWVREKHDIVLTTSFHQAIALTLIFVVIMMPVTGLLFLKLKKQLFFFLHRVSGILSVFLFLVQIVSGTVILTSV